MTIKIKRLWHGYASIRDYQAKKAWQDGEDIIIRCADKSMNIPHSEIMSGAINPTKFESVHENGLSYHLVDYPWKPDVEQPMLFHL